LSKICIYAPVSYFVGIGQCIAVDVTSNTNVIEFVSLCTKTCFNVPETLPIGKLRECHT